jgi:hypothetical protein
LNLIDENLTQIVPECEQNGAGPKGFGFLVPDKLGLVNIEKAANIHDCHFYLIKRFYTRPYPVVLLGLRRILSKNNEEFFKSLSSKKSAIKYANEAFYKNLKIINKEKSPTRFGYYLRKPIIWAYYKAVTKFGRYFV